MPSSIKKIIVSGAAGRMGQQVLVAVMAEPTLTVIAGIDRKENGNLLEIPILSSWDNAPGVDLVVDFSSPEGFNAALEWCLATSTPLVSGTTGLTAVQKERLVEAGQSIPVLWAPNMSPGINLLLHLSQIAAGNLPDYDIEIVERHHNRKKDSPSGTALSLLEYVDNRRQVPGDKVKFGRGLGENKREFGDIGVHALRGGGVVGEHSVYLMGSEEEIIITHRAFSRQVFARGAVRAIHWLLEREKGLYNLTDTFKME